MIQTVIGWIEKDMVTVALPHEHIMSNLRPLVRPFDNGIFCDKVSLQNYGELSRNLYAVLDDKAAIDAAVSEEIKSKSYEELRDIIIKELTEEIDGTDVKAGVIGEAGSSREITEAEYKFLRAAAEAQRETGFGLQIHACLWNREGLKALDYTVKCRADPKEICISHVDVVLDEEYKT